MKNSIYIYNDNEMIYPEKKYAFSPSINYPEYKWYDDISKEENKIYDSIRKTFHALGLDDSHYGTKYWNPLGESISPRQTILIKPNMVKHINDTPVNGVDCLYTHPSLVRAVLDYVLIALNGEGRIVIADAPVQSCDFDELYHNSGYDKIIDFYKQRGINVELYDLRKETAVIEHGIVVRHKNSSYNDICIDLSKQSAFSDLNEQQLKNLRITDYSPTVMNKHHTKSKHEYSISKIALEADVIINMPKIKTHRLAGMTGALKNMVGINSRKDYLPHHRIGDISSGGDQFRKDNSIRKILNLLSDMRNRNIENKKYLAAKITNIFYGGGGNFLDLAKVMMLP